MLEIETKEEIVEVDQIELPVLHSSRPEAVSKGIILHSHGFPGGPLDQFTDLHKLFVTRGYEIYSYNYPGIWKAPGRFSLSSAISAAHHIVDQIIGEDNIFLFGESFGGYISCKVASNTSHIKKIALRAPLPSLGNFDSERAPRMFTGLMQSIAMLSQAGILRIEGDFTADNLRKQLRSFGKDNIMERLQDIPVKVITGKNDQILSYHNIVKTYGEYADIELYEDLPHNDISRAKWVELLTKFDIFFASEN